MQTTKVTATQTPTKIADEGTWGSIFNPQDTINIYIALFDTTPDATTGWIPLKPFNGANPAIIGDGNLWIKANSDVVVTLAT